MCNNILCHLDPPSIARILQSLLKYYNSRLIVLSLLQHRRFVTYDLQLSN
ncbi:hypothetical protein HMPREF1583_00508 [Gardnerella vaginalis JCP8151B]|nr:hypothetical protein HMPREF1583_00508 [Gardnerella vaginalis JCP8151B]